MPRYRYERLSAQDNSFLMVETPSLHMHVAATMIFDGGPLRTANGGIDIDAIKRAIESVLHLIPRYRQRLKWIPLENRPVWIDDRQFNIDYHIRHTALPRPGGPDQLKRLCARLMGQQLDRSRPLWEMWVVEGLEGDKFAVITKAHHCLTDGAAAVDLVQILLSPSAEYEIGETPTFVPHSAPSSLELLRDAALRRVRLPIDLLRLLPTLRASAQSVADDVAARAQALLELVGWAVRPASTSPLNGRIGPHRRFDWLTMPLSEVKAVSKAAGCTVNDVVLATVSGAVRDFMIHRRVHPSEIDFRVSAPVSVRRDDDRGRMGNRVSSWIVRLPIGEPDPRARLDQLHHVTRELKASNQALGVDTIMAMAEWTPSMLLSLGARAASGPINMIVTNVPGPQIPLYLLGAKLTEAFPLVPVLQNTGLGIALFSYDGRVCWGFNADYELVPDLRTFVRMIETSFRTLAQAVGVTVESPNRSRRVVDLRTESVAG